MNRQGRARRPAHAVRARRPLHAASTHRARHLTRLRLARPATRLRLARPAPKPRHASALEFRVAPLAACLGSLVLVAGGAALGSLSTGGASAATAVTARVGTGQDVSIMGALAKRYATSSHVISLPAATAPPAGR